MTTAAAITRPTGLIAPSRSRARSESGSRIEALHAEIRRHLLESYAVRQRLERALGELDEVRSEASADGWNGYGAVAMHHRAYVRARALLQLLPTTGPMPEVSADPDGEVAFDWVLGPRKALTVSVSASGRCTFALMIGLRTSRGTDWMDSDGIPLSIAGALGQLVRASAAGTQGPILASNPGDGVGPRRG